MSVCAPMQYQLFSCERTCVCMCLSVCVSLSVCGLCSQLFLLLGVREFMPSVRIISWLEGHLCEAEPDLCVR